jgi:hypothetical protein
MHRLICCGLLFLSAGNASAALVNTLGNVSTVNVPLTGGNFNISINLTRAPVDPTFLAFQFDVVANVAGLATLNSVTYHTPEWIGGFPFSGPLSTTPVGPISSLYNGVWSTTSSLFGSLNLSLAPAGFGQTVLVSPVNNLGADESFSDVAGSGVGVTFQYVPEPSSVVLVGMGLLIPLSRKRRQSLVS